MKQAMMPDMGDMGFSNWLPASRSVLSQGQFKELNWGDFPENQQILG